MKRKSLFWCMATLVLPIMFNQLTICASAENSNDTLDTIDTGVISTYETSIDTAEDSTNADTLEPTNEEVSTSNYDITLEPTEYTTIPDVLEDTTNAELLESFQEFSESVTTSEYLETTTEDTTTTTEDTTTYDETTSISDDVAVVGLLSETTESSSVAVDVSNTADVNAVASDTENIVHTLSNTDIAKTSSSPKTNQITVIVPILLLMAGALFMSATANPSKNKS
jgi:hypothetical protein